MKKFLAIFSVFIILTVNIFFNFTTVNAAEDYTMKPLPKGYVTFIFDDANMPFTQDVANLFKEYNMPVCCAVPAFKVDKYGALYTVLKDIENNGGEILSHGFHHNAITSDAYPEFVEEQLGKAWCHLTKLGFNVNGMIEVGNGGGESTADYKMVEEIARKYYKYSNASGVSAQYKKSRRFMNWSTLEGIKGEIKTAADNNEWLILSAHSYNEISNDKASYDSTTLREILEYIKSLNGSIEVVTWNYIYNTYGEYSGPSIPSKEATKSLKEYVDYISRKPAEEIPDKPSSKPNSSITEPSSSTITSSENNSTVTSESKPTGNTTTESQISQESQSSSQNTSVYTSSNITTNKNPTKKKTSTGLIIAAIASATIAIAGVTAGIIIILKNRKK